MTKRKVILICGYGKGISHATAMRFGQEGFAVALAARNADRLATGVAALEASGITAAAFPVDLSDPAAAAALVGRVRDQLGPVTVVHWNAYSMAGGDLATASPADVRQPFDVSVTGLVALQQAAVADLAGQEGAAILVTSGRLTFYDPRVDAVAVQFKAMGLAISKAAQRKLVGLLAELLRPRGIFVGELIVIGLVKGTAFDIGTATLEASAVGEQFWQLYSARTENSVTYDPSAAAHK